MDTHPISALEDSLAAHPRVWVRLAARRLEDDWRLALLEVVASESARRVALAPARRRAQLRAWIDRGLAFARTLPPKDRS